MRLNKGKPSVIGASSQVDHKPTEDLSQIKLVGMERKSGIKVHTKPTTSITGNFSRLKSNRAKTLTFQGSKKDFS
jgi:hypothetical protein